MGRALPNPARYGLDLIFPLTFLGLLVPMLHGRPSWAAAAAAALLALAGQALLPGYWYILLAGMGGSLVGAVMMPANGMRQSGEPGTISRSPT